MIEDSAYCYGQHIRMESDVIAMLWLIIPNFTSTNIGHQIYSIMLDRIRRVQADNCLVLAVNLEAPHPTMKKTVSSSKYY